MHEEKTYDHHVLLLLRTATLVFETLSKNAPIGSPMPGDGEILSAYVRGIVVENNGCGSRQMGRAFRACSGFCRPFRWRV